MTKHITTHLASTSVLRTRAAVVAAGLGASVALGAGVALAVDTPSAPERPVAVTSAADSAKAEAAAKLKAEAAKKEAERAAQQKASRSQERKPVKPAPAKPAPKPAPKAAPAPKPAPKPVSDWMAPLNSYTLGSTFGLAGSHWSHNHSGQDFVVPTGTAVKAAHAGTVVKAGPWGGGDGPAYGNAIVISHGNGIYTQYAHLSQINVHIGQAVGKGQDIGLSGSTGNSTGPHLHFEVRTTPNYGSAINPVNFLRGHGAGV